MKVEIDINGDLCVGRFYFNRKDSDGDIALEYDNDGEYTQTAYLSKEDVKLLIEFLTKQYEQT